MVEEAALALGASRLPAAVEILKDAWAAQHQVVFLQAISTSRQQRGFDLLLDILRQGRSRDALAALDALSLHRDSPELRAAVAAAVDERATTELTNRFRERFPDASAAAPEAKGTLRNDGGYIHQTGMLYYLWRSRKF